MSEVDWRERGDIESLDQRRLAHVNCVLHWELEVEIGGSTVVRIPECLQADGLVEVLDGLPFTASPQLFVKPCVGI